MTNKANKDMNVEFLPPEYDDANLKILPQVATLRGGETIRVDVDFSPKEEPGSIRKKMKAYRPES